MPKSTAAVKLANFRKRQAALAAGTTVSGRTHLPLSTRLRNAARAAGLESKLKDARVYSSFLTKSNQRRLKFYSGKALRLDKVEYKLLVAAVKAEFGDDFVGEFRAMPTFYEGPRVNGYPSFYVKAKA